MAGILLIGQARFGLAVLEGLLRAGHEITAVSVAAQGKGAATDPLKARARESGLRVVQRSSYRDPEAQAALGAGRADLAVMAFATQIIPVEVLDAPALASVCFHPSMLPRYRGGAAINWQLINGQSKGGITIFRPDQGIDTGPVYLQQEIVIGPDDSAGSYYYGRIFEPGVALTLGAVELLVSGRARALPQDESLASHDPLCRDEHAAIDWQRGCVELHNLVRGCDPSPGAHTLWQGSRLRLYGSRRTGAEVTAAAGPGTVLAIGSQGIEVATADGSLLFAKMGVDGGDSPGARAAAAEVAQACGLKAGCCLGG